jgi:hypothetical protein
VSRRLRYLSTLTCLVESPAYVAIVEGPLGEEVGASRSSPTQDACKNCTQ